ncbi:hypothetical protein WR25_15674 [Diploscapter pachys]|uniref:Uncharacterized protein n=1 Tax=Diploscapter pachys TaxID=2018661 RepID=A0A2A2M460_9BILA|nr:hypothetical protein WR25_15674 [Diploscapter pachys]
MIDLMLVQRHRAGRNGQIAPAVHRIARIDREVQDRIFQLHAVGAHLPSPGAVARRHGDAVAQRPVDQLRHARHQLRRRDGFGLQRFLAAEGEQSPGVAPRRRDPPPATVAPARVRPEPPRAYC